MADMSDDDNVIMYELQMLLASRMVDISIDRDIMHHACSTDMRDDDYGIMVNGYK